MNPINAFRNNAPSFQAGLYYNVPKDKERWEKIGKEFEKQTAQNPEYEIQLFQTEDDKIVLSTTVNDDAQEYNILTKKGFNKLNKLPQKDIVARLIDVMNIRTKKEQEATLIANMLDDIDDLAGLSSMDSQNIYNLVMDSADAKFAAEAQQTFDKIDVFKGNVRANVSYHDIFDARG